MTNRFKASDLLCPTAEGLYCPPGDFFIDPMRPVDRALVTHGHSDHARPGHGSVLATRETLDIMALRMGANFAGTSQAAGFGETVTIGEVAVTFHPAGHVLGSAQIAVEAGPMRIVVSGDYKRRADRTCSGFEPVTCDVFITEATFGLPVFTHPDDRDEITRLLASLAQFPERAHIVAAYSLGKAQRLISLIRDLGHDAPIHLHGSLTAMCAYYQSRGIDLGDLRPATLAERNQGNFAGSIVIAPPSAFADRWSRRFPEPLLCNASGWMTIRQRARQGGVELPLVISDHADWGELTDTIRDTGAGEIWVTHGQEEGLVRWCGLNGIAARPLRLVDYEEGGE